MITLTTNILDSETKMTAGDFILSVFCSIEHDIDYDKTEDLEPHEIKMHGVIKKRLIELIDGLPDEEVSEYLNLNPGGSSQ